MLHAHSYIISVGGGPTVELDLVQCAHCGRHYPVKPKDNPTDAGSYCGRCNAPICNRCGEEMTRTLMCRPIEQRLAASEARDRFLRSLGVGAW